MGEFCATLSCGVNRYSDRSGSEKVVARTGIHRDGSEIFKSEDWGLVDQM